MTITETSTGVNRIINLKDTFLNQARKQNVPVTVNWVNGFQLNGSVKGFDSFTVIVESDRKQQLFEKHVIATIKMS